VIGLGSALRGDDGAGLEVARRLAGDARFEARVHEGEGVDLLGVWAGTESVVLVDTIRSGGIPGTIVRFDAAAQPLPSTHRQAVGHALGVAESIELGRVLGRLPRRLVVIGIEGQNFALGSGLSPAVHRSIDSALDAVRAELRDQ
jgi:hydrogenase maturation protease